MVDMIISRRLPLSMLFSSTNSELNRPLIFLINLFKFWNVFKSSCFIVLNGARGVGMAEHGTCYDFPTNIVPI